MKSGTNLKKGVDMIQDLIKKYEEKLAEAGRKFHAATSTAREITEAHAEINLCSKFLADLRDMAQPVQPKKRYFLVFYKSGAYQTGTIDMLSEDGSYVSKQEIGKYLGTDNWSLIGPIQELTESDFNDWVKA